MTRSPTAGCSPGVYPSMLRIVERTKSSDITKVYHKNRHFSGTGGPHFDAGGVSVEAFSIGQRNDRGGVSGQAVLVVRHHAAAFEKFVNADAAGEARCRIGWQTM